MDDKDKKQNKEKFPLRIDPRTVIYVTEDKCNEAYAQKVRTRYKNCNSRMSLKDLSY